VTGPGQVQVEVPSVERAAVDGRAARSAKTRNAIADALLDLLGEGHMRPTARQIAERAGVSVRSVYVHFDDLEDLFCVAADRHLARLKPLLRPVAATGPLPERAAAVVRQRAGIYARAGKVGWATRLNAEFSPTLARVLQEADAKSRADLRRVFAAELAPLDAEARRRAVAVLAVVTGADAWRVLRENHGMSATTTVECMTDAVVTHLRGRTSVPGTTP
jgi:AcrR family transcriptional regulator